MYEMIVQVPEPDSNKFLTISRLFEALGWTHYHTHYTADQIDAGEYGDDVHDYTVILPENQMDILDLLDDSGVFDD